MGIIDSGDGKSMKSLGIGAIALRSALLGAAACVALAAHVLPAFAGDDDDDDEPSFEQKIIGNLMHGIGAVNGTEKGIDYRERSPLVVPPKIDLPPPQTTSAPAQPANWPKDPDVEERRKARAEARKKVDRMKEWGEMNSPVPKPDDAKIGAARARSATAAPQPGQTNDSWGFERLSQPLSPSALGFKGFGNIFGDQKDETAAFDGEPARETLTQPPAGYQTPSPSYAYGVSSKDPGAGNNDNVKAGQGQANPVLAPGKY